MQLYHEGVNLAYEAVGRGDPLLLIHGTGAQIETWGDTINDLAAQGYKVVAYDRRGYGRSLHPPVRDYRRHISDAVAVLEGTIDGRATLIGWSSGGNVALGVAVSRPDLVKRLIVVEPPFHGMRNVTSRQLRMLCAAKVAQVRHGQQEAVSIFFRWMVGDAGWTALPKQERDRLLDNASAVVAELDLHPFGVLCDFLPLKKVRALKMPITYIMGEHSNTFIQKIHTYLTQRVRSIDTQVISGAGHFVHIDAPLQFAAVIGSAITEKTGSDGM